MRYLLLVLCLAAAVSGQAYNETINSIAYNPSRAGAYDYLKVNNLTLKGGFFANGNTTEVNLYGNVKMEQGELASGQPAPKHTITAIKPLSNYSPNHAGNVFCANNQAWPYNSRACRGSTSLKVDVMMGEGGDADYDGEPTVTGLLPQMYVYGGEAISVAEGASDAHSRIVQIGRMWVATNKLNTETVLPENLTIETENLQSAENIASYIEIPYSDTTAAHVFALGTPSSHVTISTKNIYDSCSTFGWVEYENPQTKKKVKLLACTK